MYGWMDISVHLGDRKHERRFPTGAQLKHVAVSCVVFISETRPFPPSLSKFSLPVASAELITLSLTHRRKEKASVAVF